MGNFSGKEDSGEMRDDIETQHHGGDAHGRHAHGPRDPIRAGGGPPLKGGPPGRGPMHGGVGSPHPPQPPGVAPPGVAHHHMAGPHGHGPGSPGFHMSSPVSSSESANMMAMEVDEDDSEEDVVPTVFKWEHGGRQVYIQGTFNNWERQIPMHRSGNDFTYICDLKRGKHAFKFIVDDEWRFAPDQLTVADVEGRINNFIDVTHFRPFTEDSSMLDIANKDQDVYGQVFPDAEDYTLKEPPQLPPHLRHIILNKVPTERDPSCLPVPLHVALDHLYCTAIKDGMMVLGSTQRYQRKFVSTVYYAVMP